jgi:hypothetical protein
MNAAGKPWVIHESVQGPCGVGKDEHEEQTSYEAFHLMSPPLVPKLGVGWFRSTLNGTTPGYSIQAWAAAVATADPVVTPQSWTAPVATPNSRVGILE